MLPVRRLAPFVALGVALAAVAGASAARQASLFPLADGNRWTLRDLDSGAATTISLRRGASGLVLRGFPGADALRVRRAGRAVQAWDPEDRRWEPFLRFGAPAGTRYLVDLGGTSLWRSVEVVVASKRAVVRDFRGRVLRRCTRLAFLYRIPIADAGLLELSFAPGIGPVRFSEETIAGPRESALAAFRVRARRT